MILVSVWVSPKPKSFGFNRNPISTETKTQVFKIFCFFFITSQTTTEGYGVCCVFSLGCGDSISENGTYFESSASVVGQCNLRVCPCNENICQLRLDFMNFGICLTISPRKSRFSTSFQFQWLPVHLLSQLLSEEQLQEKQLVPPKTSSMYPAVLTTNFRSLRPEMPHHQLFAEPIQVI